MTLVHAPVDELNTKSFKSIAGAAVKSVAQALSSRGLAGIVSAVPVLIVLYTVKLTISD